MTMTALPLFRLFNLTITATQRSAFVAAGQHNLVTSIQNEPGTLAMYALHVASSGLENRVIEVYRDTASYERHANSPQFKEFRAVAQTAVTQQSMMTLTPVVLKAHQPLRMRASTEQFVQLTEIMLKPGQAAAYQQLVTAPGSAATTDQAGRLVVAIGQASDDPQKWLTFEVYQDKLAYQRAQQTPASRHDWVASQTLIQTEQTAVLQPDTLVNQKNLTLVNRQNRNQ
ncbi:antibiotic biosynthesis monooxygenase family protein [Levilactobacillus tujiorum]|uniref:Antibiotic biosynthesis monooxygenase n=1 Tax=Levilactobacillus tujiorum TaxID=2912243 RepID=A0ABX1L434_9LACO|nr:antibiotic biosynthesis monooxygenase family protein [Levilactobacillus tujiorum]MCH5465496.1 antibiotic biosynthesis monooxygenase [Levilactobacillus tujiorum]NLR12582.1 antibiotic biosynthesis monooxygenase [Lactobacillus sp. HBUAS51387]NLR29785.1 antibiotic biosynthesis monooxygenase [Levilactobacillus tujiorum]